MNLYNAEILHPIKTRLFTANNCRNGKRSRQPFSPALPREFGPTKYRQLPTTTVNYQQLPPTTVNCLQFNRKLLINIHITNTHTHQYIINLYKAVKCGNNRDVSLGSIPLCLFDSWTLVIDLEPIRFLRPLDFSNRYSR